MNRESKPGMFDSYATVLCWIVMLLGAWYIACKVLCAVMKGVLL